MLDEDPDGEKDPAKTSPCWDFHNDCWLARKSTRDGKVIVKRGPVNRRMQTIGDALHGLSRSEAKQVVYDELRAWMLEPEAAHVSCTAPAGAVTSSV